MRRTGTTVPLVLVLALAGCGTKPLAPIDDPRELARLQLDVSGTRTLYAELSIAYDGPERSGTFEGVFYFREPVSIRLTVFKDLAFFTRHVFELVLTPENYRLQVEEEEGRLTANSGPADHFPARHAGFASFYWIREALCLPGRSQKVLASGASVVWLSETGAPPARAARVTTSTGREFYLEYGDYREEDGLSIPWRVRLEDPEQATTVEVVVRNLEVNPAIEDWVFDTSTDPASTGG